MVEKKKKREKKTNIQKSRSKFFDPLEWTKDEDEARDPIASVETLRCRDSKIPREKGEAIFIDPVSIVGSEGLAAIDGGAWLVCSRATGHRGTRPSV